MLRKVVSGLGALLALFHVWLFAGQVWSGRVVEPGPLVRWLLAAGLIYALAGLRRRGAPLLFGRQAVAVWLLAALLHGPAIASRLDDGFAPMVPEVVATLSQVAANLAGVALGLALIAAAGLLPLLPAFAFLGRLRHTQRRVVAVTSRSGRSPRPPPARLAS